MNHKKHLATVTLIIIPLAIATYFFLQAIFRNQFPAASSEEAVAIDRLFQGHFTAIAIVFALMCTLIVYSLIVFRRKEGDDGPGEYIHGNNLLEVVWTVIPIIVVSGFGVWAWNILDEVVRAEPNERTIQVTGQQWNWSFGYPDFGQYAVTPTLMMKINEPVLLEMEATDVLHSFWVPEFRVKQDLLPYQTTTLRITPTVLGDFTVQCAEICGTSHSQMLADVRVVTEEEYTAFEENMRAIGSMAPEEFGEKVVWATKCQSCHSVDGSAGTGPTWQGVFGSEEEAFPLAQGPDATTTITVDETYIRESICDPNLFIVATYQPNVMPANFCDGGLSDYELTSVIEFIKTLTADDSAE